MNTKELTAQLVAVHAALVDKINAQPWFGPRITLRQNGKWEIDLHGADLSGEKCGLIAEANGETPEDCIKAAFNAIAAIPDPAVKAKTDWQKSLGKVIDEGHALNLPDEVMQPLRQGSQAMTENLLAGPGVAA